MIDLHSHYLFDVDDGARTIEDSLEMVRASAEDGVTVFVATPHQARGEGLDVPTELARERFAAVRAAVEAEGIDIELALAAEIYLHLGIPKGLEDGRLLPLSEGNRYFLFELPVLEIPDWIHDAIFEFQLAGRWPVLAHPERNHGVMENPKIAREMRDRGVLIQVTAQSITGAFGRKSEKAAKKLLKWGAADIIASDAHNPDRRPPGLREAVDQAAKWIGRERAEKMVTENPERILEGREPI